MMNKRFIFLCIGCFLLTFQTLAKITVGSISSDDFPHRGKLINGCPGEKIKIKKVSPFEFKIYFERFHAEAGIPFLTKEALCKIQIQFDHPFKTQLGIESFNLKAAYNLPRNSHARTKIAYRDTKSQFRISARKKVFGPGKLNLIQDFTGKKRGKLHYASGDKGQTSFNVLINSILRAAINDQAYLEFDYIKLNLNFKNLD